MKLLPYWRSYVGAPYSPGTPAIRFAYKPNKPPKPKAIAGTGGFKLNNKHKQGGIE